LIFRRAIINGLRVIDSIDGMTSARGDHDVRAGTPVEARMRSTALAIIAIASALSGRGVAAPLTTPDNPDAPPAPLQYAPVGAGTKSYRPVSPKPWGALNKEVAPPAGGMGNMPGMKMDGGGDDHGGMSH
jgi:hypothetical protein